MKKKIVSFLTALMLAVSLLAFAVPQAPAEASPTGRVTCKKAEPATTRTLLKQSTTGPLRKNIYVDVIQGYNVCIDKRGPDFIKPTNFRIRYDSEHRITCRKDTPAGAGEGMVAARFTFTFYQPDSYPGASTRMPKQKVKCDGMSNSYYGRWGKRSSPTLYWTNSSKAGSPKMVVRASIDYQGFGVGVPDATGTMTQSLYP